jgi:glycosyltransferase involved in cell wall biosynthesis
MTRTVLYFTDSPGFGGAEQALLHLLAGLDRRRWRPVLVHHPAPGIAPLLERARDLGVELRAVPPMPMGRRGAMRVPRFIREIRAMRPAVFHAHLTWPLACKYGLTAAVLAKVPAVVATEQLFIELPYTRAERLQQRLLAAGVHRYIAVSDWVARRLRQSFRIEGHKFRVVHNAVPALTFSQARATGLRAALTGSSGRPLIFTAARLERQKGLDYLLAAAALVPGAMFALAGDGSERPRLEREARRLGVEDRVIFLGHRTDIPDLLASCDVFVLPSLFEGLPLSVLEALAAGKPVVATSIGGTDEIVSDGETGLLVPPADSHALAEAVRTLLQDRTLAVALATAGQARVKRDFSALTMVQQVTGIYDELAN